jgi:hypothetical protein
MNSQQVQDIRLMYEAVYNEELREKANEYNSIEELDEDLQQKVGKALDVASNFMKTNPVGKVVGAALDPVGPGRKTPTATSGGYRPVKEDIDLFDYLLEYLVAEGYADTNQDALVIMANMDKEQIEEATRLYYKLQRKGKGSSLTAKAQERSDADLETQKNLKMKQQRQRQMREREPDDDDPRQHGSLSAAERNPSMR